jgi:hypothetical protein
MKNAVAVHFAKLRRSVVGVAAENWASPRIVRLVLVNNADPAIRAKAMKCLAPLSASELDSYPVTCARRARMFWLCEKS